MTFRSRETSGDYSEKLGTIAWGVKKSSSAAFGMASSTPVVTITPGTALGQGGVMVRLILDDENGARILRLQGELTQLGTDAIREEFEHEIKANHRIMVDLTHVTMIASPGITLLLNALRNSSGEGRRLAFFGASPAVSDLFHRCRLVDLLGVRSSAAEASATLADSTSTL